MSDPTRSRRLSLYLGLLTVLAVACGSGPRLEDLRSAVVAEAGGAQLTGADLERWLMASPEQPSLLTASVITSTWIDEALLAEAFRNNVELDSSTLIDSLTASEATMARLLSYYRTRAALYPPITDSQADSLFESGNVRVFQRAMLQILPEGDSRAREAAELRLNEIRTRVEPGGESFTDLVRRLSESPDAAWDGLSTLTGDQTSGSQLNTHLWTLRPNDFSRIFSSGRLAVLFRRADKTLARDSLKGWLAPVLARRADRIFVDSLMSAADVKLAPDAADRVRQMAFEPGKPAGSSPLVTWQGGQADPGRVRRWLWDMSPADRFAMQYASDDQVRAFLDDIAQRDLVLAFGQQPADSTLLLNLSQRFRDLLTSLRADYTAGGQQPTPDRATAMLDSLTLGSQAFTPVPAGLSTWLRDRSAVRVDQKLLEQTARAIAVQYAERAATAEE